MPTQFAYIGMALSGAAFVDYVASYNFGRILPSFIVIHNSAKPDASWAKLNNDPDIKWDRNEVNLSSNQIKVKRKQQLDHIKNYYVGLGWTSGPHLFIDERWIWLFTPMNTVGTHAKSGNGFYDDKGVLHYSIGVETVGWFEHVGWPEGMQRLLQITIQSLQRRLKNFEIVYVNAPTNQPELHDHSISFHRDYNKPACPGAFITPAYAIPILSKPFDSTYPQYKITAPCAVFTSRAPYAPLAPGPDDGQTRLAPGAIVNVGDVSDGWLWISPNQSDPPGIGFIPSSYATPM